MPIHKNPDGTWQWGKSGKKYDNRGDAVRQMKAIFSSGYREKGLKEDKKLLKKEESYKQFTYSGVLRMIKEAALQVPVKAVRPMQSVKPVIKQKLKAPGNKYGFVAPSQLLVLYRIGQNEGPKGTNTYIRHPFHGTSSSAFGQYGLGSMLTGNPTMPLNLDKTKQAIFNNTLSKLREQRNLFLLFGREPKKAGYLPRFDYGGTGFTDLWKNKDAQWGYHAVANAYLSPIYKAAALKARNMDLFYSLVAKRWFGSNDAKKLLRYASSLKQHKLPSTWRSSIPL